MCLNFYLPVFVIIISVPNSLNLSQRSLVSKWHVMCRISSLVHLSCSRGFRVAGDRRPLECDWDGVPDSDVEETSTGESRPLSLSTLTIVQSSPPGSGVVGTEGADVSTNFSITKKYSIWIYFLLWHYNNVWQMNFVNNLPNKEKPKFY